MRCVHVEPLAGPGIASTRRDQSLTGDAGVARQAFSDRDRGGDRDRKHRLCPSERGRTGAHGNRSGSLGPRSATPSGRDRRDRSGPHGRLFHDSSRLCGPRASRIALRRGCRCGAVRCRRHARARPMHFFASQIFLSAPGCSWRWPTPALNNRTTAMHLLREADQIIESQPDLGRLIYEVESFRRRLETTAGQPRRSAVASSCRATLSALRSVPSTESWPSLRVALRSHGLLKRAPRRLMGTARCVRCRGHSSSGGRSLPYLKCEGEFWRCGDYSRASDDAHDPGHTAIISASVAPTPTASSS